MKRKIIDIDLDKCTGCGLCIPNCPEGAIQLIDGKARLVSDLMCDGLGACMGHCPEEAITIEEREAEPYDEPRVMENIIKQGPGTIKAHLEHLRDHGQTGLMQEAVAVLNEKGIENPINMATKEKIQHRQSSAHAQCPGARAMQFTTGSAPSEEQPGNSSSGHSALSHWPVQLHLISPTAPQYQGADVLLCADCVAYALGNFHDSYLKNKALAIACPKLDQGHEIYVDKIISLIDDARINTLTVMLMQVPCCSGLLNIAKQAAAQASRRIPVKCLVVGIQGEILKDEWVT